MGVEAFMLPPGDPEIAENTRTVVENGFWLCVNAVALGMFLARRTGFGRYVLLAVLVLDALNSAFAAVGFLTKDDSTTATSG
jgi:hypothetical protein